MAWKNLKTKLKDYKEARRPPSKRLKPGAKPTKTPPPPTPTHPTNPTPVPGSAPQSSRPIKKAGRRLRQPTLQEMVKGALAP